MAVTHLAHDGGPSKLKSCTLFLSYPRKTTSTFSFPVTLTLTIWYFDFNITSPFTRVRSYLRIKQHLYGGNCKWTDRQTNNEKMTRFGWWNDMSRMSMKIILVMVWRKSIHFWRICTKHFLRFYSKRTWSFGPKFALPAVTRVSPEFFSFQTLRFRVNGRHGIEGRRTDRQTDGRTRRNALCGLIGRVA